MRMTRKQMDEIARFDWQRRIGGDFDGRRYGSLTGANAPHFTESWRPCHGSDIIRGKHKPCRKTLRYNYIIPDRERDGVPNTEREVTVVHVAVRLNRSFRPVVKDVGRWCIKTGKLEMRDIDYHQIAGWVVQWDRVDYALTPVGDGRKVVAGKYVDSNWYFAGEWKYGEGRSFPYHETINPEALNGTRYEWCQYDSRHRGVPGLVDWLMMYRRDPHIELLAKAGLSVLICPLGIMALKNSRVRKWVMDHREECVSAVSAKDVVYAARHGVSVDYAQKRNLLICQIGALIMFNLKDANVRLDYDRIMKAMPKWRVKVEEYSRYLDCVNELGYDLRNEGTVYPPVGGGRKRFMARLEELELAVEALRRREERARRRQMRMEQAAYKAGIEAERRRIAAMMKTRVAELEEFQNSMNRTDILKGSGYTLIVAKSQEELLQEGKRMNNCVGCGSYGRAVAMGDSLIVMLGLGGHSHCDVEIDRRRWKVRQCYLKGNERPPADVQKLAESIAEWFKKEHRRHRRLGMFKISRKAA